MSTKLRFLGLTGVVVLISLGVLISRESNWGRVQLNIGLIQLLRTGGDGEGWVTWPASDQQGAEQAHKRLDEASKFLPNNRSARRGLGFSLFILGKEELANKAWQNVGGLATELARYGEAARRKKKYDEALSWFGQAHLLEPENGSFAYLSGLMHERLGQWDQAERMYQTALGAVHSSDLKTSSIFYRLGLIYQWRLDAPRTTEAQEAYATALEKDQFQLSSEEADTHYHLGEILEHTNLDLEASISSYRQAISIDPKHYWAHLRLGNATYQLAGDLELATKSIDEALSFWPDEQSKKWPYRILGDIYQQEGLIEEAKTAYRAAIRHDPADDHVQNALNSLDNTNN